MRLHLAHTADEAHDQCFLPLFHEVSTRRGSLWDEARGGRAGAGGPSRIWHLCTLGITLGRGAWSVVGAPRRSGPDLGFRVGPTGSSILFNFNQCSLYLFIHRVERGWLPSQTLRL